MEEKQVLTVNASPHVKSHSTARGIMLDVIISLSPAAFAGVAVFGWRAALVMAVCILSSVLFDYLARRIMKRSNTVGDLSAVVTGLLLAFNLPVTIPIWMCVIGYFVVIVVAKQFFGGIGQKFANPAITARITLLVSFASAMTNFTSPSVGKLDAISTATPLGVIWASDGVSAAALAENGELPSLLRMFFGVRAGCIGET